MQACFNKAPHRPTTRGEAPRRKGGFGLPAGEHAPTPRPHGAVRNGAMRFAYCALRAAARNEHPEMGLPAGKQRDHPAATRLDAQRRNALRLLRPTS